MLKSHVLDHYGSLNSVAKALGITKSAVSQWPDVIPEGNAYKLQFLTSGVLRVDASLYPSMAKTKPSVQRTKHSSSKKTVVARAMG